MISSTNYFYIIISLIINLLLSSCGPLKEPYKKTLIKASGLSFSPLSINEDSTNQTITLSYVHSSGLKASACSVSGSDNLAISENCSCNIAGECSFKVTPKRNFHGEASFRYSVFIEGLISDSSVGFLTVNPKYDDFQSMNWPFSFGSASQYSFDSSILELVNDFIRFKQLDQTDDSDGNFSDGSHQGTERSSLSDGTDVLKLGDSGACNGLTTNCAELDASWTPHYSSLNSYYKLNGTGSISSSAGNITATIGSHGTTRSGTTMAFTSGKLLQALNFDTNKYVNIGTQGNLGSSLNNGMTFSAWIKTSTSSRMAVISGGNINTGAFEGLYSLQINTNHAYADTNGAINFRIINKNAANGNIASGVNLNTGLSDGEWHHLAVTFRNSPSRSINIYVDSIPQPLSYSILVAFTAFTDFSTDLFIGASNNLGGNSQLNFTGQIDEVAFWKKELSESDIKTIFDRQVAKFSGTYTSRLMDFPNYTASTAAWTELAWFPTLPFYKELPDAAGTTPHANQETNSSSVSTAYTSLSRDNLMDSIVGLWHLNEASWNGTAGEVRDDSGNNLHGVRSGANTTTSTYGHFNNAGLFTGTPSYVSIADNALLTPTNEMTLSFWFKPYTPTTGQKIVSKFLTAGNQRSYQVGLGTTNVSSLTAVISGDGSTTQQVTTSTGVVFNKKWNHAVLVFKGSDYLKLYVNGENEASTSAGIPSSLYDNTSALTFGVGSDLSVSTQFFVGLIDEVALWSRALEEDEITDLYRRGANRAKLQIRTCAADPCNDTTEPWKGMENTSTSYFSELQNNSLPASAQGDVLAGLPAITFADYSTLSLTNNRYFQYRVILESDDQTSNCNYGSGSTSCSPEIKSFDLLPVHYSSASATITNLTQTPALKFDRLYETLGTQGCKGTTAAALGTSTLRYQISQDKSLWYYFNGVGWAQATSGQENYSEASPISDFSSANMNLFSQDYGESAFYFKAFLFSDGTQPCELDLLKLDYYD